MRLQSNDCAAGLEPGHAARATDIVASLPSFGGFRGPAAHEARCSMVAMMPVTKAAPSDHRSDLEKVVRILEETPGIDREYMTPIEEFQQRVRKVNDTLASTGTRSAWSSRTSTTPEMCRTSEGFQAIDRTGGRVVGPTGFHVVAGLEGGYVAEQLVYRSGATVHKAELLQLADEKYPIKAERLEDVITAAAGGSVDHIALLTPGRSFPPGWSSTCKAYSAAKASLTLKTFITGSSTKKAISRWAHRGCIDDRGRDDARHAGGIRPGRLESEIAARGAWAGRMLGSKPTVSDHGGRQRSQPDPDRPRAEPANPEGDWVHLGVAPKRDGLTSCVRRSVIAVTDASKVTEEQKYWFDLVERAYDVGGGVIGTKVAAERLPARLQEQALVDYFAGHAADVSRRTGKSIDLASLKPYTMQYSGYTERQEFFGAITLDSHEPLGNQIVTMLDVALRGVGDRWDDVVIPGFDLLRRGEYAWASMAAGSSGSPRSPVHVQELVGVLISTPAGRPYRIRSFDDNRRQSPTPSR